MVEKIEVRTTSGGFIEVTRCEEGVVWVDIKRGDGTTGISGRLEGDGPRDLARALHSKSVLVEGELQVAKSERDRYHRMYLAEVRRGTELEASTSHGAYQKLNDELAKTKAEVASLHGQVVGRGAALETWKREAELRAENHERLTAVARIFQCPLHDVVQKAESLVAAYTELRTATADGDAYVTGETWKQRDARHRETIHQLKQENANFRRNAEAGLKERAALKGQVAAARATWSVARPEVAPAEAAHVMSLTKQLGEARNDVKTMQKEVYDLKLAGKICAEAMQEWRSKLTSVCGFTFPNLVNLADIVRQIVAWRDAPEKVTSWRKGLTDALELKARANFEGAESQVRDLAAINAAWAKEAEELRVKLLTARKDFEDKHREGMAIKADHAKMRELREADIVTVKRCFDRVKELEQRCFDIEAIATGRKS